jgi:hypothetical protein
MEVGTHQELLNKGGYYARLYEMQFVERPQELSLKTSYEIRNRSYEIRTRLNNMIGSIRLLADDLVDTPEEENELLEESYSSAISILNTIEYFENSAQIAMSSNRS